MKLLCAALVLLLSGSGLAQMSNVPGATPAELRVEGATKQIQLNPKKVQGYNDLALAYLRRARETADAGYVDKAGQAVVQGLALDPKDFPLQKTEVALLLAEHRYAEAKVKATALHHHTPDDVMIYGYLAEAEIALGNTAEAEKDAQWMLNMLPNNVPGLLLGARLRVIYGDAAGAIQFLNMAYSETSPTETEDLAWIGNQIASIEIDTGQSQAAEAVLARCEQIFPGYPYTAENLVRARQAKERANGPLASAVGAEVKAEASVMPVAPVLVAPPDPAAGVAAFSPVAAALLVPQATDTERTIRNAQAGVARTPKDATAYAALGAACLQRARETGNVDDFQLAEQALTKSLDIVSADFSADFALGSMAAVCMGEHRFADALRYSQKALALGSGDVSPFAIAGDAYADMGEYDKAGLAYGRLTPPEMTLSPRAAYARDSRLSYLKFIQGDTPGTIALMRTAVAEGTEAQLPRENLAWLYYELGEYLTQAGDAAGADKAYVAALTIHPGDYRALAALGKLRANRGSFPEAIALYQRAIAVVPMPLFVAELGDLYAKTGNTVEAKKQYQLVEYIGLLGTINQVLHNRDLALFYADHDVKLPEALALARKEFEVRHDVYTWDVLAWALYKNGQTAEASKASEQALRFGTKDALLLFHAGMIADKAGRHDVARADLEQALKINLHFHLLYADAAQQKLASLNTQATNAAGETLHAR